MSLKYADSIFPSESIYKRIVCIYPNQSLTYKNCFKLELQTKYAMHFSAFVCCKMSRIV